MKSRQIKTGEQEFYYILLLKLKCETGRVAKSGFITD